MPGAARLSDSCTGHGCWPPRTNNQASGNVIINGCGAHRLGDTWNAHTCPSIPETQASGSSSVFVNGKALARIGNGVACGSFVATGSSYVMRPLRNSQSLIFISTFTFFQKRFSKIIHIFHKNLKNSLFI